jgi:hypothetical protein
VFDEALGHGLRLEAYPKVRFRPGARGHACAIEERRWSVASPPDGDHLERPHHPAMLTRHGDEAPCSERFSAPKTGRDRLQNLTVYHRFTVQALGCTNFCVRRLYSEA